MNFYEYLYHLTDNEYIDFARKFDFRKLCIESDRFDTEEDDLEMFDKDFNSKEIPESLLKFIKYQSISKRGVLRPFIEAQFKNKGIGKNEN